MNGIVRELRLISFVADHPCQGYSGIGHRRTFAVDKEDIPSNHLFKKMIEVIRILKPKLFLFENVKGIMSGRWNPEGEKAKFGGMFQAEFKKLSALGYHVPAGVLVSAARLWSSRKTDHAYFLRIPREVNPIHSELSDGLLPLGRETAPHLEDILGDLVDPSFEPGMRETVKYPRPGRGEQMWFRKAKAPEKKMTSTVTFHEYSLHSSDVTEKFAAMLANDGEIPARFQTKKFAQRVLPRRWDLDGRPGRPNITVTSLADDYVHYSQPRIPYCQRVGT